MSQRCDLCFEQAWLEPVNTLIFDVKPNSFSFDEVFKSVFMVSLVSAEIFQKN